MNIPKNVMIAAMKKCATGELKAWLQHLLRDAAD